MRTAHVISPSLLQLFFLFRNQSLLRLIEFLQSLLQLLFLFPSDSLLKSLHDYVNILWVDALHISASDIHQLVWRIQRIPRQFVVSFRSFFLGF